MSRKSAETPFHKIMNVRSKLGLFVEYGDHALGDQTIQEFATDVKECFDYLMTFRNIINGMVSFNETPEQAVLPYIDDAIREPA